MPHGNSTTNGIPNGAAVSYGVVRWTRVLDLSNGGGYHRTNSPRAEKASAITANEIIITFKKCPGSFEDCSRNDVSLKHSSMSDSIAIEERRFLFAFILGMSQQERGRLPQTMRIQTRQESVPSAFALLSGFFGLRRGHYVRGSANKESA
ncbi:hypothetical protein CDAR_81931 [Caerostris darwini]|uniref:Uncharacterized protein n=1 Tax=Caerostris darwini TaxID=1538125 RepID=A0AAV4V820_9ARAC|nr:hypothetical protein CDAR_81931 [Caerostris darwini]